MKYTAKDIGEMRLICRQLLTPHNSSYYQTEVNAEAESALLTYMQAGISVDELRTELRRVQQQRFDDIADYHQDLNPCQFQRP